MAAAGLGAEDGAVLGCDAYVSPLDVARQHGMPVQVALQLLLAEETQGHLCRDDSLSGLRFYTNRF